MTSLAVAVRWLLTLPMTIETGCVSGGRGFKCSCGRLEVVRKSALRVQLRGLCVVADGAVVVLLHCFILPERCVSPGVSSFGSFVESIRSNHVLMLVVRKHGLELARLIWFAEGETRSGARRNLRVTDGADDRTRSFEKLCAMTTRT